MRLTLHSDYALRTLMYAALNPDRLVTITEIAERYGISRNHLMRVVQGLAGHGFLDTVRGKGGGMRLLRPASTIVIGDVVRQMEPDLAVAECFGSSNACRLTPDCVLRGALGEALEGFLAALDRYTLADLVVPADRLRARLGLEPLQG